MATWSRHTPFACRMRDGQETRTRNASAGTIVVPYDKRSSVVQGRMLAMPHVQMQTLSDCQIWRMNDMRRNRAPLAVLGAVAQRRYPVGVRRLRRGNGV